MTDGKHSSSLRIDKVNEVQIDFQNVLKAFLEDQEYLLAKSSLEDIEKFYQDHKITIDLLVKLKDAVCMRTSKIRI